MTRSCATLGELVACCGGAVRTGPFGSQLHKHDYVEDVDATPVIMPKDMIEGRVVTSSIARVDDATIERLKQHVLESRDIVLARRGEIGRRAWIGAREAGWLCGTGSMRISLRDCPRVRARYLYYFLATEQAVGWLEGHSVGATMSNLSAGVVEQLPVEFPSTEAQDSIVGTLDSIGSLIDNNRRRVEVLEEASRRLYREWFVHLRFPGYEATDLVESDSGQTPAGWTVERLVDAAELVMGQSPKSEFYNDEGDGLPFHQGVTDFGPRYPEHRKWCTYEGRIAEAGDVLLSVRAPVGRINVAPDRLVIGRGLAALRSTRGAQVFLFELLRELFAEEDSMGGGTIFKAVTRTDLQDIRVVRPPADIVNSFETSAGPMFDLIRTLTMQNRVLNATRRWLLPRLMSGEVELSNLELEVEPVA